MLHQGIEVKSIKVTSLRTGLVEAESISLHTMVATRVSQFGPYATYDVHTSITTLSFFRVFGILMDVDADATEDNFQVTVKDPNPALPVVDNWSFTNGQLQGHVSNDRFRGKFEDGDPITTTTVQSIDLARGTLKTENTEYLLGRPAPEMWGVMIPYALSAQLEEAV